MSANKMLGITLLLFGILFVLSGSGTIYAMLLVSSMLSNPLVATVASSLSGFVAYGWVTGILQFVTGITSIITAALMFKKK